MILTLDEIDHYNPRILLYLGVQCWAAWLKDKADLFFKLSYSHSWDEYGKFITNFSIIKRIYISKIDLCKFCKSERIEKNVWEMQFSVKKVEYGGNYY